MHQKLKIITANNDSTLARCPSHHRQSIYCCCNIRSRVLANKLASLPGIAGKNGEPMVIENPLTSLGS
ncbi:hypothetical protein I312_104735 [Cryptococcus bacillisporus CA1280]|uniref:uncharacterized protein n=1 Tax=Cryptococcus bacillisporus CA1280 TaxID=1296109 RepID=UPI003366A083